MRAKIQTWEDQEGLCTTGCGRPATHAVLADWNPFTQRPILTRHCEADGRAAAQQYMTAPGWDRARSVMFVTLTDLQEVAS